MSVWSSTALGVTRRDWNTHEFWDAVQLHRRPKLANRSMLRKAVGAMIASPASCPAAAVAQARGWYFPSWSVPGVSVHMLIYDVILDRFNLCKDHYLSTKRSQRNHLLSSCHFKNLGTAACNHAGQKAFSSSSGHVLVSRGIVLPLD